MQPHRLLAPTALAAIALAATGAAASECLVERGRLTAPTVNEVAATGPLAVAMQRGNWGERPLVRIFMAGPTGLVEVGTWRPRLAVAGVSVGGSAAFVAADGGLVALDLRTPSRPVEVDFIDLVDSEHVTVDGSLVYVVTTGAGGNGWFDVVDVTDPTDLRQRGELYWDRPDPAKRAVDAAGPVVAVADGEGVLLIDVGDPDLPRQAGRWPREGVRDVALVGNLAAVAVASFVDPDDVAVEVLDVSDPDEPSRVGTWEAPSTVNTVVAFGDRVAAGTELDGVFVLDLGDPAHPAVVEHLGTSGVVVRHLAGAWPSLVAGHNERGLTVLGLHPSCLPPRVPSGRLAP